MDLVNKILATPFSRLSFQEKISIKTQGRPTSVKIEKFDKINRSFKVEWYEKYTWLTASSIRSKLYCWPCILFPAGSSNDVWQKQGFDDLKNLARALARHGSSQDHIRAEISLKLLGTQRIELSINEGAKR